MGPTAKRLLWIGTSRQDVRAFPKDVRRATGRELHRVQLGLMPQDWKPMKSVGAGACEIRVQTRVEHRVIYVAKFAEAIYVLHAFEKRSRKTPAREIDIARRRLGQVVALRGKLR